MKFLILLLPLWLLWNGIDAFTDNPIYYNPNGFGLEILEKVAQRVHGNVVVSPMGLKLALMALMGALDGHTYEEILEVLRLPTKEVVDTAGIFDKIINETWTRRTEVNIATRIWSFNNSLTIREKYRENWKVLHNTDYNYYNHEDIKNTLEMLLHMHSWVTNVTRNYINYLNSFTEFDPVNANTKLLLSSASYFKGEWFKSFNKNDMRTRCFYAYEDDCHEISMLEKIYYYRYAHINSIETDVVEIPYSNDRTVMLVFLPKGKNYDPYLHTLTSNLSHFSMKKIMDQLNPIYMLLSIPEFSIQSELKLRPTLESIGIKDIFSSSAKFMNSTEKNNEKLVLDDLIHYVKIRTARGGFRDLPIDAFPTLQTQINFIADRPFIFAIVDVYSTEIMFAGRYIWPPEWIS